MKKLFISFLAVGALFTSCADFDEPTAQIFGEGPSIEISAVEATDTELTFTITPGQGTNYYTYAITKGDAAKEINGEALLKDQISSVESGVMKASITPTKKVVFDGCTPNTSYVIYAVAGDANGSAGKVASKVVKTPDTSTPKFNIADAVKGEDSYTLPFSEAITRGEGKVSAKYFVEWADEPFVEVAEEDLTIEVKDNKVTFKTANVPGNCYVLISFEEGAFVDQVGNKCQAVESGFNATFTGFTGCYFQTPAVPFKVTKENVASPKPGKIVKWDEPITLTFEENVYEVEEPKATIIVTYVSKTRTVTYTVSEWAISEDQKSVSFNLPEAPAEKDVISIAIEEGIVTDVYGNPNAKVAFEALYIYETARWISLGTGSYTDGFLAAMFGLEVPTYDVEILEKEDEPGLYRVMNPYSNSVYPYADDDCAPEGLFLTIDATDPNAVMIPTQDLGFDLGYGPFAVVSEGARYLEGGAATFDVLKKAGYFGTLKDGVITLPEFEYSNGVYTSILFMGSKGYYSGAGFKVVLPKAESSARTSSKAAVKHSKASKSLDPSKAVRFSK